MDNTKNDEYYIYKMCNDLSFIIQNTKNIDQESLSNNEVLLDSMMFRLIQISENAKQLSDDYKTKHIDIPWLAIYGLRNRIVHEYGSVDLNIVYSTIKNDVPHLYELLSG